MLSCCLKCEENTKSITPLVEKARNDGTIIISECAACNTKKARFIKKQEAKEFLRTYVINDLNGEEVITTSYEKELQKKNQEEFVIEKVIKKKRKQAVCQM